MSIVKNQQTTKNTNNGTHEKFSKAAENRIV
jgi:hypothetical protein